MKDYAIVLAADLPTSSDVISVVKQVGSVVDGIKVSVATLLESGTGILGKIRDEIGSSPLLVDLKVADIGFLSSLGWQGTNAKILNSLVNSGASHVTVHGFPGPVSVAEAVAVAREAGIGVLLLPLMSHAEPDCSFPGLSTEPISRMPAKRPHFTCLFLPMSRVVTSRKAFYCSGRLWTWTGT